MAQYSRCGCQTECPCVLVGGKGIEVTGTGNVDDTYIISTDGTVDCGLTVGCVCSKIRGNTGIRCDGQQNIELFISGDQGNGMRFGQDGGLYASCPNCLDDPNNCLRSVDDLDAKIGRKQFVWGTFQGGRLLVPFGTMRSVDNAVAVMSDIDVQYISGMRGGGVALWPYPSFCNAQWTASYTYVTAHEDYCNATQYYKLNPAQWMNFQKDVANYYDSGWDNRTADGGVLMSHVLSRYDGKMVHAWFVSPDEGIDSVIATIQYWCAQPRSIVFLWDPKDIGQVVGAGIPAGIQCNVGTPTGDAPYLGNYTPTLAQEAKAAGAEWAAVSMRLTDEQIATFPAAGLKTLGFDSMRRVEVHRAADLGLAGLLSDDMVYQRYEETLNPLPGYIQHPNRNLFVPYPRSTWGVGSAGQGQLMPPDNPPGFRRQRGYFRQSGGDTNKYNGIYVPCWHLPANFGDYDNTEEADDSFPALLVGDISNHPYFSNPTGYRLNWAAGWVNADESAYNLHPSIVGVPPATPANVHCKIGMFFGAPDDRNISGPKADRINGPDKAAQGYCAFIRPTTRELVVGMRSADSPGDDGYEQIANKTSTGGLIKANELWQFYVDVTPGSGGGQGTITFHTDGGPNSNAYECTVTSDKAGLFRGAYIFLVKEELDGTEFECRFAEINLQPLDGQGKVSGPAVKLSSKELSR